MITLYTLSYNEELIIQYMINHYRDRFPNCNIILYDNESTDNTVNIAKMNNVNVITFNTNNTFNDLKNLNIKNNIWKEAETDWVLVCDLDELLDINYNQLKKEENYGTSIIKTEGYNMINMVDDIDLSNMIYGHRTSQYDKHCLFNKKLIKEINYDMGCHNCSPIGTINYSKNIYKLYHYHFLSLKYVINKYKRNVNRLSSDNIKYGWGKHYFNTEEALQKRFVDLRNKAIKIKD